MKLQLIVILHIVLLYPTHGLAHVRCYFIRLYDLQKAHEGSDDACDVHYPAVTQTCLCRSALWLQRTFVNIYVRCIKMYLHDICCLKFHVHARNYSMRYVHIRDVEIVC